MMKFFETSVGSNKQHAFARLRATRYPWILCGLPLVGFAASCGTPAEEGSHPLSNKAFVLEVSSTNWTKPPMAMQLSDYIPQFVIKFDEGSATAMPYTLASSKNGVQDVCGPTVTGTTTVEPFGVAPVEFPMHLVHPDASKNLAANTTVHNFTLTDVIPDGATPAQGSLTAMVDVRDVYKLFTQVGGLGGDSPEDPQEVCDAFKQSAESMTACEECSGKFGGAVAGPFCLQLQADFLSATETTMAISPIGADVLTTNASCAATP